MTDEKTEQRHLWRWYIERNYAGRKGFIEGRTPVPCEWCDGHLTEYTIAEYPGGFHCGCYDADMVGSLPSHAQCADMVVTRWLSDPRPADLHTHVDDMLSRRLGSHLNPCALWQAVAERLAAGGAA